MTKALRTSVFFSALIILMTVTTNLLTSPGFLWCIYPVFGVLWWPLSVFYAGRKQPLNYALLGTALLFSLFLLTYLFASPGAHPWYLYPMLAAGWWPLSVWGAQAGPRRFSVAGGLYVILTVLVINLIASPSFWWWVYPAFFVLWWPVSVLLGERAKTMAFAVGSAAAAALFTVVMYFIHSPGQEPWFLYTLLPFAWWPVSKALSARVSQTRQSLIGVLVFAAYYTALAALLHMSDNLLALFAIVGAVWFLYALGISKHRDSVGFTAVNAVLLAGYFLAVHRVFTPDTHPWYWYTFFPLAGWVYASALRGRVFKPNSVLLASAAMLLYYGALNLLLLPSFPWAVFLTGPAAVAVISSVLCPQKTYFRYSIWASAAIIAYLWAVNLVITPHALWAPYPTFAMLWWPLSMWLLTRKVAEE